jgi:hypothetical protein
VQQNPTLDEADGGLGGEEYQLADQDEVDETNILVNDARIHYRLGEERKEQ